jgi:cation:H+ antiporter
MARAGHGGAAVMENGLVNNVTNLTLLLGLPALLGGLRLIPAATTRGRSGRVARLNRLALLLTLLAALFFIAVTWALSRDGVLDRRDGLVLVALFGFWQIVHLFEVLKSNVRQGRRMGYLWLMDLALILAAAGGIYHATETLAMWVGSLGRGTFVYKHMGVLSGLLMVLPNAALALGYNLAGRPEVVYSSQVGDGHICIPMAIGLYALIHPMQMPPLFELGAFLIVAAVLTHILLIAFLGRLPRMAGALLLAVYGVFLWKNFA